MGYYVSEETYVCSVQLSTVELLARKTKTYQVRYNYRYFCGTGAQ